jgi:hypothetical protein
MSISLHHVFCSSLGEKTIPFIKLPFSGNVKVAHRTARQMVKISCFVISTLWAIADDRIECNANWQ